MAFVKTAEAAMKSKGYPPLVRLVYSMGVKRNILADALGVRQPMIGAMLNGTYPINEYRRLIIDDLVLQALAGKIPVRDERRPWQEIPDNDFWERDDRIAKSLDSKVASEMGFLIHHENLVVLTGKVIPDEGRYMLAMSNGSFIQLEWVNGICPPCKWGKTITVAGELGSSGGGSMTVVRSCVVVEADDADLLLVRAFVSRYLKPKINVPMESQNACKQLSVPELRYRRKQLWRLSRLRCYRLGGHIFTARWLYLSTHEKRGSDGKGVHATAGLVRLSATFTRGRPEDARARLLGFFPPRKGGHAGSSQGPNETDPGDDAASYGGERHRFRPAEAAKIIKRNPSHR